MRIVEVEYLGPPALGGVEVLVEALYRGFSAAGHSVEIWSTDLAGFDGARYPAGPVEVNGMAVRRFRTHRSRLLLLDPHHMRWDGLREPLIEEARRGSVLHVHSFPSDQFLKGLAAAEAGGTVVITPHHDVESFRRYLTLTRAKIMRGWMTRLARECPGLRLTVHTPAARDLWIREIGWPERRVTVIPNGVDLDEFDSVTPEEVDAAARRWPGEGIRLLFVGRLARSKGVDILLRAVARVPECTLLVVGFDAGALSELQGLRKDLSLEERVEFATLPRREVCAAFRACGLFVLPSRFGENFGIAAVEAMAAGRPIVVSDRGGLPSLVHKGANGLVFPAESPEKLAEAIARLAGSPELRRRQGKAGRRIAETHYTWEQVVRAYLDLFTAAAAR